MIEGIAVVVKWLDNPHVALTKAEQRQLNGLLRKLMLAFEEREGGASGKR